MHAVSPAPIPPQVLYQASVGAGVDQLGLEDCGQCDPARGHRLHDDVPRGGGPTELVTFGTRDLSTIVSRQPVAESGVVPALRLDGSNLVLESGTEPERRFPLTPAGDPPLPSVRPAFDAEPKTLTVRSADGVAHEYVFDAALSPSILAPLHDGSVVVSGKQTDNTTAARSTVYQLHPDGSITTGRIDGEDDAYSSLGPFVDERGVVELQRRPEGGWNVVLFPLPT